MYYIKDESLQRLGGLTQEYARAKPFPHWVFTDLFYTDALEFLAEQFPKPSDSKWYLYDNVLEKKFAKPSLRDVCSPLRNLVNELMENRFVWFLEQLTGIEGLIVDHTLNGGGLHQITRGGKLDIHADYNYHPITNLDRRLNAILYLNPYWEENWGGQLELWDSGMQRCVRSINPSLGTLVVFSTTDTSFHGHPDPLDCPPNITRKSIALYYYTNGRPAHEKSPPHSVLFQKRPQDAEDVAVNEFRKQRSVVRRWTDPKKEK